MSMNFLKQNKWIVGGIILVAIVLIVVFAFHKKKSSIAGDKNCTDFKTHAQAQKFYEDNGGPAKDPYQLDRDRDGIACETLP